MEASSRAAVVLLALASSCSLIFGERGVAEDAPPPAPAAPVAFLRVPSYVRPTARDLARSADLCRAIERIERRESLAAAIALQSLRARERWGAEVAGLHAWALVDADAPQDARRVAQDGLAEYGPDAPALNYALAVAEELNGAHAAAYDAYARAAAAFPADPVLQRACARTALAAGDPATALLHLAGVPDAVAGAEGLALARLRAEACAAAARHGEAVVLHERITEAHGADLLVRAESAAGAFAAAEASGADEWRRRARALAVALAEADPQHADAHWMIGRLSASLGEAAEAESALRRTLELAPARTDAGLLLAGLLGGSGRREEARKVLFELLRQPLSSGEVETVQGRLLELEAD